MTTKTVMLAAAVLLVLGATGARAQFATTSEERAACRSDALKLCFMHVGSLDDMRTCMISKRDKLSNACRKVVDSKA